MYGKRVSLWMIMFTDLNQWKMRSISSELNPTSLRKKQKQGAAPSAWQDCAGMITRSWSTLAQAMELITSEYKPSHSTDSCFTLPSKHWLFCSWCSLPPSRAAPELVLHALHISSNTGTKEWTVSNYEICTPRKDLWIRTIWCINRKKLCIKSPRN